jgi:gamma-glutamyl:cysteine ligase YbdK (ATP-grasp superfamily)
MLKVKVALAQWSLEVEGDEAAVQDQIERFYSAVRAIALGQTFAEALQTAAEKAKTCADASH